MPTLPLTDYRATETATPRKLHKGLDATAHRAVGRVRSTQLRRGDLRRLADEILEEAQKCRSLKGDPLRGRLRNVSRRFRRVGQGALGEELLRDALAPMCEAIFRKTHLHPYPEQIMGAIAINRGFVAEMATGEGKTLTIGLAAALEAWRSRPCHVITANDYLVQRDAEWLRAFYEFCGIRVGYVLAGMEPPARRDNYARDITYVTSKEVVADFLRDRIQLGAMANARRRLIRSILQPGRNPSAQTVMRGLHSAIVDEADHVLIDEAVTPLIISRQVPNSALRGASEAAAAVAADLEWGKDYVIDTRYKDIELKPAAKKSIHASCENLGGLWRSAARREELIVQALHAREFFKKGKQYIVDEDQKIVIVDEFTGRMMPQRTWKQGLHQAVEAKEEIPVTIPTETISRLSFQRFFRLYRRIAGGTTGTANEAAGELWQIYRLPFTAIPTHKPCVRNRYPQRVFCTEGAKWEAIVDEIAHLHEEKRPILVGTRSIAASEHLAGLLDEEGLSYQLLNATRHREEANIIAEAGRQRCITIATNMAGRGTDIKLGDEVEAAGGMHVIATEAHEAGRIDRQLIGRCARQGEPGSARVFASLEDELVRRFLPEPVRRLGAALLDARFPGANGFAVMLVHAAQRRAERFAFRQRSNVLKQDEWIDEALSFSGPDIGV